VELLPFFEFAPDRLSLAEIGKNIDGSDSARLRPRWCLRRSAFRQPWSSRYLLVRNCLQFSALADLRREMSTKSNNNAAAAGHV
jgi:hypothetical protein